MAAFALAGIAPSSEPLLIVRRLGDGWVVTGAALLGATLLTIAVLESAS